MQSIIEWFFKAGFSTSGRRTEVRIETDALYDISIIICIRRLMRAKLENEMRFKTVDFE